MTNAQGSESWHLNDVNGVQLVSSSSAQAIEPKAFCIRKGWFLGSTPWHGVRVSLFKMISWFK